MKIFNVVGDNTNNGAIWERIEIVIKVFYEL
jgi:hypothetical protein